MSDIDYKEHNGIGYYIYKDSIFKKDKDSWVKIFMLMGGNIWKVKKFHRVYIPHSQLQRSLDRLKVTVDNSCKLYYDSVLGVVVLVAPIGTDQDVVTELVDMMRRYSLVAQALKKGVTVNNIKYEERMYN